MLSFSSAAEGTQTLHIMGAMISRKKHSNTLLQDIAWARSELSRRGVTGPGPLPEYSE